MCGSPSRTEYVCLLAYMPPPLCRQDRSLHGSVARYPPPSEQSNLVRQRTPRCAGPPTSPEAPIQPWGATPAQGAFPIPPDVWRVRLGRLVELLRQRAWPCSSRSSYGSSKSRWESKIHFCICPPGMLPCGATLPSSTTAPGRICHCLNPVIRFHSNLMARLAREVGNVSKSVPPRGNARMLSK